jgi:hypothetical protein
LRIDRAKQWQHVVTDQVSGDRTVGIGSVFAPRLAKGVQMHPQLAAGRLEHGAHEAAAAGSHGGQADAAGTPRQAQQDGFRLVVARMR